MIDRRHLLGSALGVTLLALAGPALADYPEKPIRFIVTWPAGGTTDVIARVLAPAMSDRLGQPVAVANVTGGGGSVGTRQALDAPKDGYTVLVTTSGNHILTPLKSPEVGYEYDDFVPIGQIASRTMTLAVGADAPWEDLNDLAEDAGDKPGEYTFAAVPDVMPHLTLASWMEQAGVELRHVPQQGGAPGVQAVLGGHIDMVPASLSSVMAHFESGDMRGLAVFNEERDPAVPDVPTAKEQGYDVVGNPFTGLAVAEGVPEEAIETLRATLAETMADPEFQERAETAGASLEYLDAEAFGEVWARDWANFKPKLQGGE